MKASLISKIILAVCILCLITGIFKTEKYKSYEEKSGKQIITNSNKAAVLEMDGTIASSYESGFFSSEATGASTLLKNLIALQNDNDIKGVIIKLNTPGGTVAMSQNIYNQIIKLRKTKPVITVIDDMAASGGYYIASATDRIIAQEGSLTGSIGVIFSFMDYHDLLINKLNVNQVVIKSGKFKDIGSGTRKMSEEERVLMQEIVDDSYAQFISAIIKGRIERNDSYSAEKTELTKDSLASNADGRVFTGKLAKEKGFVDILGDIDTGKITIEKMMQEKYKNKLPVKLVNYSRSMSFKDYFSGLSEYNSKSVIKLNDLLPTSVVLSRKPLYLWE